MLLDMVADPTEITDLRWLHHVMERPDFTYTVREIAHRLSTSFADIEAMQGSI